MNYGISNEKVFLTGKKKCALQLIIINNS